MSLRQRAGDQPLPVANDHSTIHEQVCADLMDRQALGITRYGQALQPHNGRNALLDAYQEALDLSTYLKQLLLERERPVSTPDADMARLILNCTTAITQLSAEVTRLHTELRDASVRHKEEAGRLRDALAREQDAAATLRQNVRTLQGQVAKLENLPSAATRTA